MSENPIISVITVVKNGENVIKNCMESVKNQNAKNIEHIIIDGKSDDDTVQIIKKNLMSYTKFISELDTGLYDAMNKGLTIAKGEFIHFLNADDLYFESKSLKKVIKKLDKNFISHGLMMYNKSNGNKKLLGENDQILLAHHLDDAFETILLRLFRGTGVDGLSGLDERRSLGKGEIIRPFLNLYKSDLRIFVESNKLNYVEDDTNKNNDFDRNFLRNEIIPSLDRRWKKLPERVSFTSKTATKKKLSLDFMLEMYFEKEIKTGIISREEHLDMPNFLKDELIRLILRKNHIALPNQKVLTEIMKVFFLKKPSNESFVEWSRKDGEQAGGKVFSEHNNIIFQKK